MRLTLTAKLPGFPLPGTWKEHLKSAWAVSKKNA